MFIYIHTQLKGYSFHQPAAVSYSEEHAIPKHSFTPHAGETFENIFIDAAQIIFHIQHFNNSKKKHRNRNYVNKFSTITAPTTVSNRLPIVCKASVGASVGIW